MELSVGEVAKRTNVKVSTLHFYEQRGLIYSGRNAGNQRRYERSVLRRVAVIKAAQQVGLSLDEVAQAFEYLPKHQAPSKAEWERLATEWHDLLEVRIQKLKNLQTSLGSCIGCGCLSLEKCQLYNPDDSLGQLRPGSNLNV
ncbi:redox-sensitive transcriptional activator SoxR [Vibrio sp. AK197]